VGIEGLVSTIIPVYNRASLVQEAIDSVLAQTYRPIEIIVVDDGSTDDTSDVVEKISAEHDAVRLYRQENQGPGSARQRGLNAARGEFIQFLDSDDLLRPNKFEWQVGQLRLQPECGVCYGWTTRYPLGGQKQELPIKWTAQEFETMFPSFLADRWWDTSTPLYRAERVHANGPWLNLRLEEDWEFDCRLASTGIALARVNAFVSDTRVVPAARLTLGGSSNPALLKDRCIARIEILRHAKGAGIPPNDEYMRQFLNSSFLVARQTALAGLEVESATLLQQLNEFDRDLKRMLFLLVGRAVGLGPFTRVAESARSVIRSITGKRRLP
jgi:glycosyltransferase involved in cell wall biosynthesis